MSQVLDRHTFLFVVKMLQKEAKRLEQHELFAKGVNAYAKDEKPFSKVELELYKLSADVLNEVSTGMLEYLDECPDDFNES